MAYFAELDENNIVLRVISISNNDAPDPAPENSEEKGKEFILNELKLDGKWIQTSFNKNFRKNFAGIGFFYDEINDIFIDPQPYPSWTLNENFEWQPPIPNPGTLPPPIWDEETLSWVETPS